MKNLTIILVSCSALFAQICFAENLTIVDRDPQMQDAIKDARASLGAFFTHVLHPSGESHHTARLKVSFMVTEQDVISENIWISHFDFKDDGLISGVIANMPVHFDATYGDYVTFERSQIVDWALHGEDNLLYGSFTTRAMLELLPDNKRENLEAKLSKTPIPEDW